MVPREGVQPGPGQPLPPLLLRDGEAERRGLTFTPQVLTSCRLTAVTSPPREDRDRWRCIRMALRLVDVA